MRRFPNAPSDGDGPGRFQGRLRHYHRKNSGPPPSWDDWIDADRVALKRNWTRIIFAVLGLLVLIAIGIGLYIEMRS